MNKSTFKNARTILYRFEPGDATRYTISVTHLQKGHEEIVKGIHDDPSSYTLITIFGYPPIVMRRKDIMAAAVDPHKVVNLVLYASQKFPTPSTWTLAMCLLLLAYVFSGDHPKEANKKALANTKKIMQQL